MRLVAAGVPAGPCRQYLREYCFSVDVQLNKEGRGRRTSHEPREIQVRLMFRREVAAEAHNTQGNSRSYPDQFEGHRPPEASEVGIAWARRGHSPARCDRNALHRHLAALCGDVDPSGLRPRAIQRFRRASNVMAAFPFGNRQRGRVGRRRSNRADRHATGA